MQATSLGVTASARGRPLLFVYTGHECTWSGAAEGATIDRRMTKEESVRTAMRVSSFCVIVALVLLSAATAAGDTYVIDPDGT